ncbi:MAG: hypothetical protein ACHP7F_08450 [Actinomycetales bacterium]
MASPDDSGNETPDFSRRGETTIAPHLGTAGYTAVHRSTRAVPHTDFAAALLADIVKETATFDALPSPMPTEGTHPGFHR